MKGVTGNKVHSQTVVAYIFTVSLCLFILLSHSSSCSVTNYITEIN